LCINNYITLFWSFNKFLVFSFFFISLILSWLGQCLVESPYLILSCCFTFLYFFILFIIISTNYVYLFFY
jgi:hypothetical protein